MAELKVQDLSPALGAEIEGLVPQIPLDGETCHQLQALFDERSVLVFHNLDIDEAFQRYLVYTLIREEAPPGQNKDDDTRPPFLVSNKEPGGGAP